MSYTSDNMDQLEIIFQKLGLSNYESLVFSTLVENSPASATILAKKCNLSRSSVYTTLASLISKGLVGVSYKNEIKQFIAQDFSSLQELIDKEKETVNNKLKVLEKAREAFSLYGQSELNFPQIIFFEGQEGLKKIYSSMMREAPKDSTLYLLRDEFVWTFDWKFIFEDEWNDLIKRQKSQKNIRTKLLINNSVKEQAKAKYYHSKVALDFKFLPKDHSVKKFAVYIIGDVVSILSLEKNNLVGIKITNQHLADNFKNMFELLWN